MYVPTLLKIGEMDKVFATFSSCEMVSKLKFISRVVYYYKTPKCTLVISLRKDTYNTHFYNTCVKHFTPRVFNTKEILTFFVKSFGYVLATR